MKTLKPRLVLQRIYPCRPGLEYLVPRMWLCYDDGATGIGDTMAMAYANWLKGKAWRNG